MTREKLSQYGNLTAKKYTGKLFPNLTFWCSLEKLKQKGKNRKLRKNKKTSKKIQKV
jgi:hypothetical protein